MATVEEQKEYWASEEIFAALREWAPRKSFQKGEYTTGQIAREYNTTSGTVIKWCQEGVFGVGEAWQDDIHKWWHITERGVQNLEKQIRKHKPREVAKHVVRLVIKESK